MFKESATARYILRAAIATALAFCSGLVTALSDNGVTAQEWALLALATVGALAAYLGIGAGSGSVEPFIGRKLEGAEVPVPPATPELAEEGTTVRGSQL